jgi:hypothetical protein
MAQQHTETPELIYQTLVDDAVFMEMVGEVKFERSTGSLPAISILTPGADLPEVRSINGLEVIIHDVANLSRREYITNQVDITTTWKVFLLAWQGSAGGILNTAARRIMERFSKATTIETNPAPQGLGAIAQILVLIPSDSVIIPPLPPT